MLWQGWFESRSLAYKVFFLCAAGLHAVSVTMLLLIDPEGEKKRRREQPRTPTASAAPGAGNGSCDGDLGKGCDDDCCACRGGLGWVIALPIGAALAASAGGVCVHEALQSGNATADASGSGAEGGPLRFCGASALLVQPWHHGILLGCLLLALALVLAFAACGCLWARRRRRYRLPYRPAASAADVQKKNAGTPSQPSSGAGTKEPLLAEASPAVRCVSPCTERTRLLAGVPFVWQRA